MDNQSVVLCAANAYEKKYYLNPDFDRLPEAVQEELQILMVTFTEEIGGILILAFDPKGSLQFQTQAAEGDAGFDEIGAALRIKQIRYEKQELLESLELYYRLLVEM